MAEDDLNRHRMHHTVYIYGKCVSPPVRANFAGSDLTVLAVDVNSVGASGDGEIVSRAIQTGSAIERGRHPAAAHNTPGGLMTAMRKRSRRSSPRPFP